MEGAPGTVERTPGQTLATITDGLASLHTRCYGKGPIEAKSHQVGDQAIVCFLRIGFTTVEQTLIDAGREESVKHLRCTFQEEMGDEFKGIVEGATGRVVEAYLTQVSVKPPLVAEIFMLEPLDAQLS
jgi:uncharacterized protein YbcI